VNGQHAAASPYSLYVSPSDAAIGVIVAVVLLTVAAACIIGYIIYQRRQVRPRCCCPSSLHWTLTVEPMLCTGLAARCLRSDQEEAAGVGAEEGGRVQGVPAGR